MGFLFVGKIRRKYYYNLLKKQYRKVYLLAGKIRNKSFYWLEKEGKKTGKSLFIGWKKTEKVLLLIERRLEKTAKGEKKGEEYHHIENFRCMFA